MDPVMVVVVLVAIAVAAGWWLLRRRTPPPEEDEWTLPAQGVVTLPAPAGPPVLNREMMLRRDRVLDPSKWDDTPDGGEGSGEPAVAGSDTVPAESVDLPRFFDREYLQRRERTEETGA